MGLFGKKDAKKSVARDGNTQAFHDDEAGMFESASALLKLKRYDEAIKAYESLAARYPARKAECEKQIAAAKAGG